MQLNEESLRDLVRDTGARVLRSWAEDVYVDIESAPSVARWLSDRGERIVGFDGLHSDGNRVSPDLDHIADLSSCTTAASAREATLQILGEWRRAVRWVDFSTVRPDAPA